VAGDVTGVAGDVTGVAGDVTGVGRDVLNNNIVVEAITNICSLDEGDGQGEGNADDTVNCRAVIRDILAGNTAGDILAGNTAGDILAGNTAGDVLGGDVLSNNAVVEAFRNFCGLDEGDGQGEGNADDTVNCLNDNELMDDLTVVLIGAIINNAIQTGDIAVGTVALTADRINVLTDAAARAVVQAMDNGVGDIDELIDVAVTAIVAAIVNDVTFTEPLVDAGGAMVGNVSDVAVNVTDVTADAVTNVMVNASDRAVEVSRNAIGVADPLVDRSHVHLNNARAHVNNLQVRIETIVRNVLSGDNF
jgi:hypothetical protein